MASRLSIAMRREAALKQIDSLVSDMAVRFGVTLPPAQAPTKDPAEAEAVLLESLAVQLEALAGAVPPTPAVDPAFPSETGKPVRAPK